MRQLLSTALIALVIVCAGSLRAEEAPKWPEWVPVLPEAKPELIENKTKEKETSVTYVYRTKMTPAEVKAFYEKGFETSGFKKETMKGQTINDEGNQQENLKGDDGKRYWYMSARLEKDSKETIVSLVYQTKG